MYRPGFNSFLSKTILKELQQKKKLVSVPRIALYSDAEISEYKEPVNYINGVPVHSKYNHMYNTTKYIDENMTMVNGKVDRKALSQRTHAYLPIATIIDLYHEGYSIYLVRKEDITMLAEYLSNVLNRLENSLDNMDKSVFEYIEEFYKTLIKTREVTLENEMIRKTNDFGVNMVGFTDDTISKPESKVNHINIDDIIVN